MQYEKLSVSWDELKTDMRTLATMLDDKQYKGIIAITRGGLTPACLLSNLLNIRMFDFICALSYNDDNSQRDNVQILRNADIAIKDNGGEGWILVDDLSDTGNTFKTIKEFLPNVITVTPYVKELGKNYVDKYVYEISQSTWIIFPWDQI